jgi:hypothetical protein
MRHPDNIYLILADTDRFNNDNIHPHGIHDIDHFAGRSGDAAQSAAGCQAADKDPGIVGMTVHPDSVTKNRPTGKRAGGIDRHNTDPLPLSP